MRPWPSAWPCGPSTGRPLRRAGRAVAGEPSPKPRFGAADLTAHHRLGDRLAGRPARASRSSDGRRWPACLVLWSQVTAPAPFLFEGGYFLFALAVAVVIFCVVTAQSGSLSRALGNPVFRYIGKISYGTYLWHVPLFPLLDATRLHLYGLPLLAVRIGATLVVATGSFYLVEEPIRGAGCDRSPSGRLG